VEDERRRIALAIAYGATVYEVGKGIVQVRDTDKRGDGLFAVISGCPAHYPVIIEANPGYDDAAESQ